MADRLKITLEAEFSKSIDVLTAMSNDSQLHAQIGKALTMCVNALRSSNKLLFAGNGGSAADAQHWAGELVSRFNFDRPGLPGIALSTDTSILTAIGNDYGYDYVFARQVEALGRQGDVLLAISTSGNSKNIVRAIQAARAAGIAVIGFTGKSGGAMGESCDICFRIPSTETPKIQEGHEFLGHLLCGLIEQEIFGDAKV
ncbi:D-sedoheptulose 7-phosphate isomerase [Dyella sp. 2HG41-7]|uniref:D-sedoheptulose-7-phosphate isomerase n=1 Tax=Dyella sp. 2HG41-7 TaxID=2883239 RepID=UPI0027154476|nr:D-sedoheptulose 7-phosphate isomerase [Dyella sp. 2HG41-7]